MWQYNQNALYHHGIKGQRWGVRRYQNSDGTLTAEGKLRSSTDSFTKPIRNLIDSLTETQRGYIGDGYWIDKDRTAYRNVIGDAQHVDAFLDVYNLPYEHAGEGTVVLAVANEKSGQGYGTKLAKQLVEDYEAGKFGSDLSNLIWRVDEGNTASDKIAEKAGFIYDGVEEDFGEKLNVYRYYKTKPISHDELYHHGIKGQRWGVRRYQNPDGTLTALGRRRMEKLDRQYEKAFGRKPSYENVSEDNKLYDARINPNAKPGKMSDDELVDAINRLQLEKRYKDLLKEVYPQPKLEKKKSLGKRFIDETLVPGVLEGSKDGIKVLTSNAVKKFGVKTFDSSSGFNSTKDQSKTTNSSQTNQNSNKKKWGNPTANTSEFYKVVRQSGLDDILNDSMFDISNAAAKAKTNYEEFTKINRKLAAP